MLRAGTQPRTVRQAGVPDKAVSAARVAHAPVRARHDALAVVSRAAIIARRHCASHGVKYRLTGIVVDMAGARDIALLTPAMSTLAIPATFHADARVQYQGERDLEAQAHNAVSENIKSLGRNSCVYRSGAPRWPARLLRFLLFLQPQIPFASD